MHGALSAYDLRWYISAAELPPSELSCFSLSGAYLDILFGPYEELRQGQCFGQQPVEFILTFNKSFYNIFLNAIKFVIKAFVDSYSLSLLDFC